MLPSKLEARWWTRNYNAYIWPLNKITNTLLCFWEPYTFTFTQSICKIQRQVLDFFSTQAWWDNKKTGSRNKERYKFYLTECWPLNFICGQNWKLLTFEIKSPVNLILFPILFDGEDGIWPWVSKQDSMIQQRYYLLILSLHMTRKPKTPTGK